MFDYRRNIQAPETGKVLANDWEIMSYDARQKFIQEASEEEETPPKTKLIKPKVIIVKDDILATEIQLMSAANYVDEEDRPFHGLGVKVESARPKPSQQFELLDPQSNSSHSVEKKSKKMPEVEVLNLSSSVSGEVDVESVGAQSGWAASIMSHRSGKSNSSKKSRNTKKN